MITAILSISLFLIFMMLGGAHFYWLLGGKWGLKQVIPSKKHGANIGTPPKFATLLVALILSSFGTIYLIKSGVEILQLPDWVINYVYWFIPIIFILRAIGEFNYLGFFKKVKETEFAEADSKIFSPLCLAIGITGFVIQLFH